MATPISNVPAKSIFEIQGRDSNNSYIDAEEQLKISGVIHTAFARQNMVNQTTNTFGVPMKFLNGTFYYMAPTIEQAERVVDTIQNRLHIILHLPYGGGDTLLAWDSTEEYSYQLKYTPLSLNIDKQGNDYIVKLRTKTIASPGYIRNPMR